MGVDSVAPIEVPDLSPSPGRQVGEIRMAGLG